MSAHPDVVVILTDQERAPPPYEDAALGRWRDAMLPGRRWFAEHGVVFERHYTGSLACVPSRPTLFTGHYPDLHGVSQTDGFGKLADDSRMRWLRPGEVPTLGHYFRAAGYDTHYDGKWHLSHADLMDPATGEPLATNRSDGTVMPKAVQAYLEADPLGPYGFSGWVGPEPHGRRLRDSGLRRDPLIASRVVAWLTERYARRRAGDERAMRPFLLVASFVNPHDIVLFPAIQLGRPLPPSPRDPPEVAPPPTRREDLSTKPAVQRAYRDAYYSAYGPRRALALLYARNERAYRKLYYRLHAEVDDPLDRVRRAVTEQGSENAILVQSADHGELLGAHGGLHQKWFSLYDEATRVPLRIARIGEHATTPAVIQRTPTSHIDIVPTLLSAAGLDGRQLARELEASFTEVHPLPGRDLMPLVQGGEPEPSTRAVYLMTRDHVLEGDGPRSVVGRILGIDARPLGIQTLAGVGTGFEGLVTAVPEADAPGGREHIWKIVRTFDDPATWTEPFVRQVTGAGKRGESFRTEPLSDEWELYDLDQDPFESVNLASVPGLAPVLAHLTARLNEERTRSVPPRRHPWPYAARSPRPLDAHRSPLALLRNGLKWLRRVRHIP